ncbi:MAG TPA: hypothetical protein PLR60_06285 [Syntrophorhabdaceae bacterium]|nr:hypothetical protein [Syntrophorhabdaceae bacterium]
MKRAGLFVATILSTLIFCSVIILPLYGQEGKQDFSTLYRNYFKTIIDGNYSGAWDGLTGESKLALARLIAREAKIEPSRALQMLNDNEQGVRDEYFKAFRENIREILDNLYEKGKYTIRSTGAEFAVITIEIENEPKDFKILKQDGKWKVNFFQDLLEGN